MPGTKIGGKKAAIKNKKDNPDFYRIIGARGGKKGKADGTIKGFAANKELARRAGALGGNKSRRLPGTHCRKGHEFNEENTFINSTTKQRTCKICRNAAMRKRYHEVIKPAVKAFKNRGDEV